MPCLIAILLTLFPVLFASGEAVAAVKFGGGITVSDVGISLCYVSCARGEIPPKNRQAGMTNVAKQRPYIFRPQYVYN
ncbi:MAG: hypothetical protein K2L14_02705 [Duncaniella sp.]|nr:hypothetical protein [Duncaniella sp.]